MYIELILLLILVTSRNPFSLLSCVLITNSIGQFFSSHRMSNKEEIYPATKLRKPDSLYQFQSNSNSQLQTVKEMSGFLYASPVQKHDIAEDNSMPQPISKSIQKNCIDRGKAMEELAGSIKMISNESLTNSYPDNSNFKIERYFNALREDRLKDTSGGKEKKWGKLFVRKKKDENN